MLSDDELTEIKKKLIDQINSSFPEDKKTEALEKINSVPEEKFEEFLIQNNLIQEGDQKCIFCSIIEGKMPTNKFAESEQSIATLEINPISKGHSIIIPKVHSKEAPKEAFEFAEIIKERIQKTFSPKKVEMSTAQIFDHEIINLLPIYENQTINSEKQKATQEELQKIQKKLIEFKDEEKSEEKILEKPNEEKIISDKTHWLPKRIP